MSRHQAIPPVDQLARHLERILAHILHVEILRNQPQGTFLSAKHKPFSSQNETASCFSQPQQKQDIRNEIRAAEAKPREPLHLFNASPGSRTSTGADSPPRRHLRPRPGKRPLQRAPASYRAKRAVEQPTETTLGACNESPSI